MGAAQGVQLEARMGRVNSVLSLAVPWRNDATTVPIMTGWLHTSRTRQTTPTRIPAGYGGGLPPLKAFTTFLYLTSV